MTELTERIISKLSVLNPTHCELINESHKHAGHAGSNDSGESHFKLKIASPSFKGLSKVKAHQLIYKILAEELKAQIHALSIEVQSCCPDES